MKIVRIYKEDLIQQKDCQKFIDKTLKNEGFDLKEEIQEIVDYVNGYTEYRQKDKKRERGKNENGIY